MACSRKIEDFVLAEFQKLYPEARSELNFNNSYQLSVAVILSAQCTDKKVNEISPLIFKKWPDFPSLSKATVDSLAKVIRPVNYYKTKARNLVRMAREVGSRFGGKLPGTFEDLMSLPGIGRKSAGVILGELGEQKTLPVDTHVFRVSRRLGLARENTPEKVEMELRARFDPESWYSLHHGLILHGRRICKAQNPICSECHLFRRCPHGFGKKKAE